jgi:MoxR-like ATPase
MTEPPAWADWMRALREESGDLDLPIPFFDRYKDSRFYDPGPDLEAAVKVALLLGQPLLLTGEPGCGKTSLAYWLADQLEPGAEPLAQVVKSGASGKDLLYGFDELSRFRDAYGGPAARRPLVDYLEFRALGRAILFSGGPEAPLIVEASGRSPEGSPLTVNRDLYRQAFPARRRNVVLIDEMDKAPRDTPNDLLSEIERMEFHIPELGVAVRGDKDCRPVVVITSNSDKSLPEPFLRRCVYHHIPAPDAVRRRAIVAARRPPLALRPDIALFEDALATFETIRVGIGAGGRQPGTAELLAWLDVIDQLYAADAARLMNNPAALAATLTALAKTKEDRDLVRRIVRIDP